MANAKTKTVKYVPLKLSKTGRTAMEKRAGARLKTVVLTSIIPDYVKPRIRQDTGRLMESVRMGDNGRYKEGKSSYGVEVPILIGGTEEASLYDSRYGDAYGDKGAGTVRTVDYVAELEREKILSDFGGDLFETLPAFIARSFV